MTETPILIASCQCGQLSTRCVGPPNQVIQCHCRACQARTGGPFGVGAYFDVANVEFTGERLGFTRPTLRGNELTNHFCPQCGSTVFWMAATMPGLVGIPIGLFDPPLDIAPGMAVFDDDRCSWVPALDVTTHRKGTNSEQVER